MICWWRVCLSKDIVVSSLRRAEAGYYSAAALLLRPHGAVDVALEPVEELALVARDREVEELAVRLEVGDERAMDASVARRKLRPLIEDIVASYEYCSWEKAGNSESDYPGIPPPS